MAVITKSDIAEINNDLSNIKSELSEKLFLHEKEQDEKIEKILEQLSAITNLINTNLDYEQKQNKRLDFLGSEVVWLRTKHIGLENAFGVFAPLTLKNIKLLRLIISIVAIGAALGIYLK